MQIRQYEQLSWFLEFEIIDHIEEFVSSVGN